MSFRQFGGLNYSAKSNIITNQYSNSGNLGITDTLGQPNSKIVSQSHIDMSANSVLHIGKLYFMDGTVQATAASNTTVATTFPSGIIISGGNISITSTTSGNITGTNLITANTVQATTFTGGTFTGTFNGNASTATSLVGGASYKIPYQTNTGTTAYIDNSSVAGQVLISNPTLTGYVWSSASALVGDGALTLTCNHSTITGTFTANQSSNSTIAITLDATNTNTASTIVARDSNGDFSANLITANLAGTATYASNLSLPGSSAGSIPYQTAASSTTFLAATTTNGSMLAYNTTTNAPEWVAPNATTITTTDTNTAGPTPPAIPNGTAIFPVMTSGLGSGQYPYIDSTTTPFSYTPSSGTLTVSSAIDTNAGGTTFNLLNTPTTITFGNAATAISIGAASGTLTIRNPIIVPTQTSVDLLNTVATTINFGGVATALTVGAASGTLTINSSTIATSQATVNLLNTVATTINFGGVATTISIGAASATGQVTINSTKPASSSTTGAVVIAGGIGVGAASNFGSTIQAARYCGTASTTATPQFAGGSTGSIPVQSAADTTGYLGVGSLGQVLTVTSGNALAWQTPSTTATTATNLAGGGAYNIPYQSAANTTSFIANGADNQGQVLTFIDGTTNPPSWAAPTLTTQIIPDSNIYFPTFTTTGNPFSPNGYNLVPSVSSDIFYAPGTGVYSIGISSSIALNQVTVKTSGIAIGYQAGNTFQGNNSVAIGSSSGQTNQGQDAVAIGSYAGGTNQGQNAVAIGSYAGGTNQGQNAVAIGSTAGAISQGQNAVAVGYNAGGTNQGNSAVAIGVSAGENTQGPNAVAIGQSAGAVGQGSGSIGLGYNVANENQGVNAVAIGVSAAKLNQGNESIAIGYKSGGTYQRQGSIAIGSNSGQTGQGGSSVPINFGSTWSELSNISTNTPNYWTAISTDATGQYVAAVLDGSQPGTTGGIWVSSDYGTTWINRNTSDYRWSCVAVGTTGEFMVAAESSSIASTTGRVYLSTNYGVSWTRLNTGNDPPANTWVGVAISSNGQNILAVNNNTPSSGTAAYITSDSGLNWVLATMNSGSNACTCAAMTPDGNYQIIGTNGGRVYISFSGGTFQIQNSATDPTANSFVGVSVSDDHLYYAAVANGASACVWVSANQALNWTQTLTTVDDYTGIKMSSTGQYMAVCASSGNIYTSINYGSTWTVTNVGGAFSSITVSGNGFYTYVSVADSNTTPNIYLSYGAGLSVALGYSAGQTLQGASAVAVGALAGQNTQGQSSVAIGRFAGQNNQGQSSVAIGSAAGGTNQGDSSVAIGYNAGQNTQGNFAVAIGANAGRDTQGTDAVAIGSNAGQNSQGQYAIAIGYKSGQNTQNTASIAIGPYCGNYGQQNSAIAIGQLCGQNTQGQSAIALGGQAGQTNQGNYAVAVGNFAGSIGQGQAAIAVGNQAGQTNQGNYAVAIGYNAGQNTQGQYAIAIGTLAGQTNQPDNSIVINATGNLVTPTTQSSFYVSPIRNVTTSTTNAVLYYHSISGEISCDSANFTYNGSTLSAPSFTTTSDYRIKENPKPLDESFNVDKLKPVTYKNKITEKQDIGFIAHEVQEEFPCLVIGEKDGEKMQSLNYIGLTGVLVKEIQELKKRVSILENK